MTVSMTTWESMMSMLTMISRMVAISSRGALMMRALVRSSAKMTIFSGSRSPSLVLPVLARGDVDVWRGAASAASDPAGEVEPGAGLFSFSALALFSMSWLRISATSFASACSRRCTSTKISFSRVAGVSSRLTTSLMKAMASGLVMTMRVFVRLSEMRTMSLSNTLRWDSAMIASSAAGVFADAGSGSRRPGRVTPGGSVRRSIPGAPVERSWGIVVPFLSFSLFFAESNISWMIDFISSGSA